MGGVLLIWYTASYMRTMGQRIVILFILVITVVAVAYGARGYVRDAWEVLMQPRLPPAELYTPLVSTSTVSQPAPAMVPTRTTSVTTTKPSRPTVRPAAPSSTVPTPVPLSALPEEKLLAVPFMSQSPLQDWTEIGEDACEEASVLMVRGYYEGITKRYDPNEAERMIRDLVRFEIDTYGFFESTSATATVQWIEAYMPTFRATVLPVTDARSIKVQIAAGHPVILPADGKALRNPNFKNGGPIYHMLVVRGYTKDGMFITNDPGTRKGETYLYSEEVLLNAVHDWNNGDVPHGRRVMILMTPRS
jgi:hypothetical protein